MSVLPKRYYTPEEYLTLELAADYRSQYLAGEIFAMAGAQPWHVRIVSNLVGMLHSRFRGRPCDVWATDMRLRVKAGELYTYPDVMALCGQPLFDTAENPQSLLNPQVIFEVLSPTTEAQDRGEKFARYRQLESLTDYVLVDSERMRVEQFIRQPGNQWLLNDFDQLGQHMTLASLSCDLPLVEIYERVDLPPALAAPLVAV